MVDETEEQELRVARDYKPQTQIEPSEERQPGRSILSFVTVLGTDKGLCTNDYTVAQELEILIGIARDQNIDPETRISAIEKIREHVEKPLRLAGLLPELSASKTYHLPDGSEFRTEVHGLRAIQGDLGFLTDQMLDEGADICRRLTDDTPRLPKEISDGTGREGHSTDDSACGEPDPSAPTGPEAQIEAQTDAEILDAEIVNDADRDLGGGGICESSQVRARRAREAVARRGSVSDSIGETIPEGTPDVPSNAGDIESQNVDVDSPRCQDRDRGSGSEEVR